MKVITSIQEQQKISDSFRKKGETIGFVPTMGCLHEGHLSLVRKAWKECDRVIVSIFVNPTQFGPDDDFDKYPRQFEEDRKKLEEEGVEILFHPSVSEMYPGESLTKVSVAEITEGRKDHFDGVSLIVTKFFNIVKPHKAYFGQKDLQQAVMIQQLVQDLNFDIDIDIMPTVREHSGLAMSSRNRYLKPDEFETAAIIYRTLEYGKEMITRGQNNIELLRNGMYKFISKEPSIKTDNIEILNDGGKWVILIAVRIGDTRLIDNIIVDV